MSNSKDKELLSIILADDFLKGMFSPYIEISREITNKKILDFGCGYGWGTSYLSQHNQYVVGYDIREDRVCWAEDVYSFERNVHFTHIWSDVKQQVFDVIVLSHVLHELENPFIGTNEIVKILKNEGRIYIAEKMQYKKKIEYFTQDVRCVATVFKEEEKTFPIAKGRKLVLKSLAINKPNFSEQSFSKD